MGREMISAIFAWFARIGERGDHALGGLGIWPCLTRRLLKVQDGSMTANIEGPGESSPFVPRRPAVADIPAPTRSPSPGLSPEPDSFKPACRRILVVDDNIDAARSLAKVLTLLHGQNVEVAHDGPSALETAEAFRPQIVLLDIGLPGMSGHKVAEQLRRRPWFEGGVLVAVTGWGQEKDRATSRAAGFDHHLVKPVNQATLQNLLDGNLGPDH
jgi:CheY-like chemotaxis protein